MRNISKILLLLKDKIADTEFKFQLFFLPFLTFYKKYKGIFIVIMCNTDSII